ncbi:hypothetical protein XBFM1_2220004 [Xenorhabdus bovienii str. feltiae Moldova]|uniref:LysR substrate-binding domain-containing protein n=2 Tax=Xenorhabdus bovienii TaxID=40576 RepID=A0A077PZR6_XENBV|nr:hypothetical protein XBFM1_2220004 [Xenorhabdus bovienii str. feltiae Moldova]CDH26172.1 hypothetical protein XBKB1_470004 [Xenorhabdus bovienii str. kraussei Becker Underwood]
MVLLKNFLKRYSRRHSIAFIRKSSARRDFSLLLMCQWGDYYAWEFKHEGRTFSIKLDGQLVFNSTLHQLNAALDGVRLAYIPEHLAKPYLADGRLQAVLTDYHIRILSSNRLF